VAVAYVVVSWLLIQAASILFSTFEVPPGQSVARPDGSKDCWPNDVVAIIAAGLLALQLLHSKNTVAPRHNERLQVRSQKGKLKQRHIS
jgi:hypothetical protein